MDRDLNPDLPHLKAHVLPDLLLGSLQYCVDQGGEATMEVTMEIGVIEMLQGRGSVRGHSWCSLPINHKNAPSFHLEEDSMQTKSLEDPKIHL